MELWVILLTARDKMTNRPYKARGNRAIKKANLIHINVCRRRSVQVRDRREDFITFTNDYSRCYIYLMHHNFEAFEKFQEHEINAKKQLGVHIKLFLSNQGSE